MDKIVGLDLDGVILDHSKNKIRYADLFGVSLTLRQTPSEIMETIVDPVVYGSIQKMIYGDPAIASHTPLITGARSGLMRMKRAGILPVLISRRFPSEFAVMALKKHGLWGAIFSYQNAFFVREKKDKDTVASRLGINTYLDDEPSVLRELASVKTKFLFDPMDAYRGAENDFARVHSWSEFIRQIT